jgi:hypothetical protein
MNFYNEHKSWILTYVLLKFIETQPSGMNEVITVQEADLQGCINSLKINDFNFNFVKGLEKNLAFENYKIIYKEAKILKVKQFRTHSIV